MSDIETFIDGEFGTLVLYPNWLTNADHYFSLMANNIAWTGRNVTLFGKSHPIPRSEAWVGEPGISYRYSGQTYVAQGWPDWFGPLIDRVDEQHGFLPNSALLNKYIDGAQSMGWHADDEPELGVNPTLAILSLGESRDICFRRTLSKKTELKFNLPNGSLLLMAGALQNHYQHSVPKRAGKGCRISCTFRKVF